MKRVWKVPFDGRLESFTVVKWTNREALLKDWKGQVKRITPSQFEYYVPTKADAITRARRYAKTKVTLARRNIAQYTDILARLDVTEKFSIEDFIPERQAEA